MEDVVALRVIHKNGRMSGVMTRGRIIDPVDESWLAPAFLHTQSEAARADILGVLVCKSLQEVRDCEYFYEGLIHFAHHPIPFGDGYKKWRKKRRRELEDGTATFYLLGDLPARS